MSTVSGDVDRPVGRDVNVHEVVDDPALNVSIMLVDQNFLAGVKNLDEAVLILFFLVDGFILSLVMLQRIQVKS